MQILIVGYGKMGKTLEQLAPEYQLEVGGILNTPEDQLWKRLNPYSGKVAIEFTQPDAAFSNITTLLGNGISVVSGTTGWKSQDKWEVIKTLCHQNNCGFFYASNFSIGMNIFFYLNKKLASIMAGFSEYHPTIEETHHTEKLDAPSGTAITLAEGILEYSPKTSWVNEASDSPDLLSVISHRLPKVPGTHEVVYQSTIDTIRMEHIAHSREGFARGALMSAKFLVGKTGVFGMEDLLALES